MMKYLVLSFKLLRTKKYETILSDIKFGYREPLD